MSKVKVLLVDDEKEYADAMAERLRSRGCDVTVATSGEEALERVSGLLPQQRVRVLLVDDEVEYVETMAERLRLRGFDVAVATSGGQAIEMTRGSHFGAVVVDYAMPMMDGIATIKELRGVDPDLPFILLSGETTIKVAVEAARMGAVDLLEKPVDISTIVEKLELAHA